MPAREDAVSAIKCLKNCQTRQCVAYCAYFILNTKYNSFRPFFFFLLNCFELILISPHGTVVIREVNRRHYNNKRKSDGVTETNGVSYKVEGDSRSAMTEADEAAQDVILRCLRDKWGDRLHIVGEEEEEEQREKDGSSEKKKDVFSLYGIDAPTNRPLSTNILPPSDLEKDVDNVQDIDTDIPFSELTVFVDPLDGTREFVEGRMGNVQCLIGVVRLGKPVMGVIGLPFGFSGDHNNNENNNVDDDNDNGKDDEGRNNDDNSDRNLNDGVEIAYGALLPEGGVMSGRTILQLSPSSSSESEEQSLLETVRSSPIRHGSPLLRQPSLNAFTGDSKRAIREHALSYLQQWNEEEGGISGDAEINNHESNDSISELQRVVTGGAGNKFLRVASGRNDCIAVFTPGTCSWDTAAPTAVLLASLRGGKNNKGDEPGFVTDLFGGSIAYENPPGEQGGGKGRVSNDMGVICSRGALAVRYHERLIKKLKSDDLALDSLLGYYWDSDTAIGLSTESKDTANILPPGDDKENRVAFCGVHMSFLDMFVKNNDDGNAVDEKTPEENERPLQAIDIFRDESGFPYTVSQLHTKVVSDIGSEILFHSVTNSELFRLVKYRVPQEEIRKEGVNSLESSDVKCFVKLVWEPESVEGFMPPSTLIYSRNFSEYGTVKVTFSMN